MEAEALPNTDDRVQSSGGDEELAAPKQDVLPKVPFMADWEKPSMEPLSAASASNSTWKEEEEQQRIKMAKAEMREVREENERLKKCLDEIIKDYETLKRKLHEMMMGSQRTGSRSSIINNNHNHDDGDDHGGSDEDDQVEDMVSLTLGRFSSPHQNHNKQDWGSPQPQTTPSSDHIPSPTHSTEPKEEDQQRPGHTWPPSKVLKASPATGEDEVSHQNPPKKTRVCVRARCDTPTMNDGCQWRKYGQKIAKGNPCPRAYYRCTGAPSCPVRKQVQRSVDDISILITTYEGTHNHPLPVSAMAMASTTSAAASMLLSGPSSSTTRPGLTPSLAGGANLHGMNLYLSNNANSKQFYLPNSPMLSSSLNHPTITLDLTSNPPSTSSSSPFHKIPSTTYNYPPKYPFTSLDFGSTSQPNFMSLNNNTTTSFGNNNNQAYNIGNNKNNAIGMASDFAKQLPFHTNIYQACLQQFSKSSTPPPLPLPDTIAAATKAITSDPSFQSALAAALSSIIGGGNECASTSLSSQQGSMVFQPPKSLTCSTSKSPSSSPGDSRDNAK